MRVVFYHSQYYEYDPVPDDVAVTQADVDARLVIPSAAHPVPDKPFLHPANWRMRVTKDLATHTVVNIPESNIFHTAFHKHVRPMRLTRRQAVALHLDKDVVPERFPRESITSIEVEDDGPHEETHRALLDPHLANGKIDDAGHAEHLAALTEHHDDHSHAHGRHLAKHFGVDVHPRHRAVS